MSVTEAFITADRQDATSFDSGEIRSPGVVALGNSTGDIAGSIDILPYLNLEQSVRVGAAVTGESPLIPTSNPVRSHVYGVQNGLLTEVA